MSMARWGLIVSGQVAFTCRSCILQMRSDQFSCWRTGSNVTSDEVEGSGGLVLMQDTWVCQRRSDETVILY